MTTRTKINAALVAIVAGLALVVPLLAGGDKVAFPANYASGVLYWTQDRPQGNQVRDYYTSREAVEAAKKGAPLPSGTVITVVQYGAKFDAEGKPVKDSNGRFIKDALRGYTAMEKRTGWGSEYPENIRNGEWEYQTFTANKTPNTNANLTNCFTCHKMVEKADFVYSYENLKTAELPKIATR